MTAGQGPHPSSAKPASERLNTRAAGIIGLAVMCSRVLGLIREQVCAALFGGGGAMDAFTAAFRIPNLLRDLFAEGALSTAFVTTFSKTATRLHITARPMMPAARVLSRSAAGLALVGCGPWPAVMCVAAWRKATGAVRVYRP